MNDWLSRDSKPVSGPRSRDKLSVLGLDVTDITTRSKPVKSLGEQNTD